VSIKTAAEQRADSYAVRVFFNSDIQQQDGKTIEIGYIYANRIAVIYERCQIIAGGSGRRLRRPEGPL